MSKNKILGVFIIGLFLLAWAGGYYGAQSLSAKPALQGPAQVIAMPESSPIQSARIDTPSFLSETDSSDFTFSGWTIDNTGSAPAVCLTFSGDIKRDPIAFTDGLSIAPDTPLVAEITDETACVSGLDFDTSYTLTMKDGLAAANGETLARSENIEISFGNRPPFLAFANDGIILPRAGGQGVAIETVNVETIAVEIHRVSDRILARRDPDSGEITAEGDYSYEYYNTAQEVREEIWSGTLAVKSQTNMRVTTVLPLKDMVGEFQPGAYIISAERKAEGDNERPARAWRWIISTDLALTSYTAADGLSVIARSLQSAVPQSGIRLDLIADNNEILDTQITDGTGKAHFDAPLLRGSGALSPRMVMVYGADNDFTMLDLNRSALDLTAFAIDGRAKADAVDGYIFAERGIYRPGETANITLLLRDAAGHAIEDRAGHLRVTRPGGAEYRRFAFSKSQHGAIIQPIDLPSSAPRGLWRVTAIIDGLGTVASTSMSVEDFAPQQLAVSLKADEAPMRASDIRDILVQADFLYGAPGTDLTAEAEARIRIDPNPFADFKSYEFGLADRPFRERLLPLGGGSTDKDGVLVLGLSLEDENLQTSHPLRAEIAAGVSEPGGRYVRTSTRIPVRTNDIYVGIDKQFENRAEKGKPAGFHIIAVSDEGARVDLPDATWRLVEEDWHYNWYRTNGQWRYRRDVKDVPIAHGNFDIAKDVPAQLSRALGWGDYRLIIETPDGAQSASLRFSVGWGGSSLSDAPDQIQMGGPDEPLNPGDMLSLSVNAPYAGIGELVLADSHIRSVQTVEIPAGGAQINVPLPADLSGGIYAMLSLYTPRDARERPVPRRAVGLSYIDIDKQKQKLDVGISVPEIVRPRQTQSVRIEVGNIPRGERAYITLSAVDTGILQITKYKTPDLAAHFFGKFAFNLDVRDDYARILNANLGAPAIARSGGDSLGGEGLTSVPIKTVSLFSGPIAAQNGAAVIDLDLPDFNGELRLMAHAYSETALGSASQSVKVRDAVPLSFNLPRFLAPGDTAMAVASLDNLDGQGGVYNINVGATDLNLPAPDAQIDLPVSVRKTTAFEIGAEQTGISDVNISVSGPDGYGVNSAYNIQTRSPYLPISRLISGQTGPGEVFRPTAEMIDGLHPIGTDITMSFARTPGLDPTAYAAAVSRYPYGCTEQTVSAALPLLYAKELGGAPGISPAKSRPAVQKSVDRLLNRQGQDGAFGLWSEGDEYASPWIGVYAADFILRASEEKYLVSAEAKTRTLRALHTLVKMDRYPSLGYNYRTYNNRRADRDAGQAHAGAYAHYVLARNGAGNLPSMRHFQDTHSGKMRTPLAQAYLGAALSMMGDNVRARRAFTAAQSKIGYQNTNNYYQSALRDIAGTMAMMNEAGYADGLADMQSAFDAALKPPSSLNTQQLAYTILAIKSFLDSSAPVDLASQGVELSGDGGVKKAHMLGTQIGENIEIRNQSDTPIWHSVLISGQPIAAPEPFANGFKLDKKIYKFDGKIAALDDVQKGDKLIVKVQFSSSSVRPRQAVLADLLPAGFEIETIMPSSDGGKDGTFPWLGELDRFQVEEARDDRLVAALETYRRDSYSIAYIVRAVTVGDYIWPGAVVEDMYRPADQAITAPSRVNIRTGSEG